MHAAKITKFGRPQVVHITGMSGRARTAEADHHYCESVDGTGATAEGFVSTTAFESVRRALADAQGTARSFGIDMCGRCEANAEAILQAEARPIDPEVRTYQITFANAINRSSESYSRRGLAAARELAASYRPYNNTKVTVSYVACYRTVDRWTGNGYKADRMPVTREVSLHAD